MEQSSTNMTDPASDAQQPASEGGLVRRQGARLQARLQPIVQIAGAIAGKVRVQAIFSGVAGLWLWGLLFYPFVGFGRLWVLVLGVVVLGLLMSPAGVLFLFWAGLRQLIGVPDKLLEIAGQSETHTDALLETISSQTDQGKVRRLRRFFRTVLDLRLLVLESKELLLQFAVVVRIANPVFIAVLFVAFVLSLLLVFVAVVSFFVMMVF